MRPSQRGVWLATAVVALCAVLGGVYGNRVQATVAGGSDIPQRTQTRDAHHPQTEPPPPPPIAPERVLFQGAIPGMLRSLDPHSGFFDPRAFSLLREDQNGHYYGVEMQVASRDGRTIVLAPFVGSPAYKAGLRPGDIIYRVDDTSTENLSTSEVADLLKGPKGTVVRVQVLREGSDQPLEFVITRDEIPRLSVDFYFEVRPRIGYVRLAGFNENTHDELARALESLKAEQLEGLILARRGNPGGLLNEGVAVADLFLAKNQLIVSHRGRAQRERRYYAQRGNQGREFPLIVLLDRFSASAPAVARRAPHPARLCRRLPLQLLLRPQQQQPRRRGLHHRQRPHRLRRRRHHARRRSPQRPRQPLPGHPGAETHHLPLGSRRRRLRQALPGPASGDPARVSGGRRRAQRVPPLPGRAQRALHRARHPGQPGVAQIEDQERNLHFRLRPRPGPPR